MRLDRLLRRKVAIWGFGQEGQAAYHLIRSVAVDKELTLFVEADEAERWDFVDDNLAVVTHEPSAGELAQFQVVIKSPGISPYQDRIKWAHFRGARFISGATIWFAHHKTAKTLCVTGTKGKSTTCALIAHLMRRAGLRVGLVGNIGVPLLTVLDVENPPDWWVIELSSYQTENFAGNPAVAVVLNLYPEHLSWHGTVERYYADKLKLLTVGKPEVGIVNGASPTLMAATGELAGLHQFGVASGWHARDGGIYFSDERLLDLTSVRLQGAHNAENICAALAAIDGCGLDAHALIKHVATFVPLPHRLQRLGARAGVEYYDDSIATTPHATIAALSSFSDKPCTVLVGGFDRGVPWEAFADHVTQSPPHAVITMGQNGGRITDVLRKALGKTPPFALHPAADMADAVNMAQKITPQGGRILLSPGAPSFDAYVDYAERGRDFAGLAGFSAVDDHMPGLGIA